MTEVKAEVPMSEMLTYAPDLRSMTSGQGEYTLEFLRYEEIPAHLAQKVADKAQGRGGSGRIEACGGGRGPIATLALRVMAEPGTSAPTSSDIACDVCGRTLLRGEHAEHFLAGGERRMVCDLCTARAQHEGWIRESGADDLEMRHPRHEGRSFIDRLRSGRRERPRASATRTSSSRRSRRAAARGAAAARAAAAASRSRRRGASRAATSARCRPTPSSRCSARSTSSTRPTTRARSAASPARSARPASACARASDRPAVVSITVMWELSWYRFEVDLSDEAGGVRRDAQGDELSELIPEEQVVNAAADERGALHLGVNT